MENITELPNAIERRELPERRKENKLIAFQDRRINEWRRAADRMERNGRPATALLFRNEAYQVEGETSERLPVRGAFAVKEETR